MNLRAVSTGVLLVAGLCLLNAKTLAVAQTTEGTAWKPLKGQWKSSEFGGEGKVETEGSTVKLGLGDPLTGVQWKGEFPRDRYELSMEARRVSGADFFCGVTFPVGDGRCSLILGGWGGGVVGLSNINGEDASSNETTQFKVFENGQWYRVRIRVEPERVLCYIDDKEWVQVEREGREFDIRIEMDPTLPMGLANFLCESEIRDLKWRPLSTEAASGETEAASGETGAKESSTGKP